MNASSITIKGQVVVPARLRRKFGIKPGTRVHFYEKDGEIRLVPLTQDFIDAKKGFLGTKGALRRALAREKKREREL